MEEKKVALVNLTPHDITFVNTSVENPILVVGPSGLVARVSSEIEEAGRINGIPVTKTVYGEVVDLPEPKEGIVYIVSSLVAQRCPDREDVFVPADPVRDDKGRIIGCKSLGRI